jgi:ribosomal protein L7/L12
MSNEIMEIANLRLRVAKLERTMNFLLQHFQLEFKESPETMFPDVITLARQGKTLDAIKLYRDHTGAGLQEAKQFVESLKP